MPIYLIILLLTFISLIQRLIFELSQLQFCGDVITKFYVEYQLLCSLSSTHNLTIDIDMINSLIATYDNSDFLLEYIEICSLKSLYI